jgi:hypothetical protein
MKNKLPPRDRPLTIDADAEPTREVPTERLRAERARMALHILRPGLFEKVVMIALVAIIFGQVLDVRADPLELALVLAVVVVANAALSTWLDRGRFGPGPALRQFIVTGLLNLGIFVVIILVVEILSGEPVVFESLGFFLLLMTLLITLYDRYRPEYLARFSSADT